MEALLLITDVFVFVLLLLAVYKRERASSDKAVDLGYFAYRRDGEEKPRIGKPHA